MDPGKYADKIEDAYEQHFGEKLNQKHRSPY